MDLYYRGPILVLHNVFACDKDLQQHRKGGVWFCSYAKAQIDQEKASRYTGNLPACSFFQSYITPTLLFPSNAKSS